jgi:hypothetical protein
VPDAVFPHRAVITALRIDLTDPDLRLFTTPRISDYVPKDRESAGLTVNGVQRGRSLNSRIYA